MILLNFRFIRRTRNKNKLNLNLFLANPEPTMKSLLTNIKTLFCTIIYTKNFINKMSFFRLFQKPVRQIVRAAKITARIDLKLFG